MTASPVDGKDDVVSAARDLETLLSSHIATASDLALLRKTVTLPSEEILKYQARAVLGETELFLSLQSQFGDLESLAKIFDQAKAFNSHLGPWCSDYYWRFALSEKRALKAEARIERSWKQSSNGVEDTDKELAGFRQASELVKSHVHGVPRRDLGDLSSKVIRLYDYLLQYFKLPSDHRCIVFVEQRHTARLLHAVFELLGGQHLRPGLIIGAESTSFDGIKFSFRTQVLTLMKFRKGEINCLFATSVAEEGLDVPDCNLVVRFDLAATMIKYVQSRGRARHKNSKFIHMIELGNSVQERLVQHNRYAEMVMRKFCQALPADRLLMPNDDLEMLLEQERTTRSFVIKATGAKLTYTSSLIVLANFVSLLPSEGEEPLNPCYFVSGHAGHFICEVILPTCSPVRGAIGDVCRKKALAKCSAAFNACLVLRKEKLLDEDLLPVYKKRLSPMRNLALVLSLKQTNSYPARMKPAAWSAGINTAPSMLYMTLLDAPNGLDRPHQPLVLLTRIPLPRMPVFPLFLDLGCGTLITTTPLEEPLHMYEDRLDQLTSFTLCIFKDIFNKLFEHNAAKTSYWLAPASESCQHSSAHRVIDWPVVEEVHLRKFAYEWAADMPAASLLNRFLVDPNDGGRRLFSTRLASEYIPLDPVPANTVSNRRKADNILDYSVHLWRSSRDRTWDHEQPVIEAEQMLHRRNMLAMPNEKETKLRTRAFVCPEPLRISPLPARVVASCLVFPAVIHRLESYLIAAELGEKLGLTLDISLALEAITKDSDNSDQHETEQPINFRHGMGNNYERLEFLGDCFLKMATSIAVFNQNPNDNEFEFHVRRMMMLCNQTLFNVSVKKELHEYIRSESISRRTWYPESLKLIKGKGDQKPTDEIHRRSLGQKTIADVSEALMGAAFLSHNDPASWRPTNWDNAVRAVTQLVDSPDHTMMSWADYSRSYVLPAYQIAEPTAAQLDLVDKVEREHPYRFRYPKLLRAAFLHPSFPFTWEHIPSYQRLEFLGDSLLDLACVTHLFYRYADKDPHWLTKHKTAMVANKFLGAVCVRLGFHKHLRYNSSILLHQIGEYATELQEAERVSEGRRDFWVSVKDPPKCLPDIVEAYIGAMFIDSDFNYGEVQRFFGMHIKWYFEDMTIYDTFANSHPMARLHNVMAENFRCSEYRLMIETIPSGSSSPDQLIAGFMIHNQIVAGCYGESERYLHVRAAKKALDELHGIPPFEFRAKFGCTCPVAAGAQSDAGITVGTETMDLEGMEEAMETTA